MSTFKPLHLQFLFCPTQVGQENWGADHSMHALQQQANWLPFVSLKPERDPHLEKKMVELRSKKNVDELLRVKSKFFDVTEAEVCVQIKTGEVWFT